MLSPEPPAARRGTEHAFDLLYALHHRAVLAYCARRATRADAWDATADVFLVAWRRIAEVPPPEEARAWLFGVAFKVLSNQRRSESRLLRLQERVGLGTSIPAGWPEELMMRGELELEVAESLARLGPKDREILQLTHWEDLSPTEIATVLGISRAAVDQRYSRAKRRLARLLGDARPGPTGATRMIVGKGGET